MLVFKATNENMKCTHGRGTYQYKLGAVAKAESAKCANRGLHACEYVLDCTHYYSLDGKNRFFAASATGSIDEDDTDSRIACESLTLVQELTVKDMVTYALLYMIRLPDREWEMNKSKVKAVKDKADGTGDGIAIARGRYPVARGEKGDVIGLLRESKPGWFTAARACVVDGKQIRAGVWYTVTLEGEVIEADEEVAKDEN